MSESYFVTGQLVDIIEKRIYHATVQVANGKILNIVENITPETGKINEVTTYILPGFIDAHNHLIWSGTEQEDLELSSIETLEELLKTNLILLLR